MTDKEEIKFAIRYLKQGLKSKRTPPLYEELMNELGFEKKVNNHSGVAVDFFKENYPEYVTEKGECLSPYWDLFSAGVICATFELNNEIAELEAQIEKMKCCGNCARLCECGIKGLECKNYDKWEIKEE